MTQLISNVLMQPKPDAVEPLTLIEKLENFRDTQTYYEATFADAVIDSCIDIVKQHEAESEVQEKIYQQEMDKIKSCGCGCILPDYLTQCPDCEALDD